MKNITLKLAVLAALGISAQVIAAGFVNIPTTGFATSAYTLCNTTGNFGSSAHTNPTAGANNTCAIVSPIPANEISSPETNYAFVTSATRPLAVNNIYTSGSVSVGSILEVVWRKPAASAPVTSTPMCIIGARVSLSNIAYSNATDLSGKRFELNDLARGGLGGLTVDAAYAITTNIASTASPVFRIGRTFTSVQHRALATAPNYGDFGGATAGVNYLALPGLGATTASINGVNRFNAPPLVTAVTPMPLPNPTVAQQDAGVNGDWVDFTFDANALDDDGGNNVHSAVTYVKIACNNDNAATINSTAAGTGWTRADALRLRQTAQEISPFISISTSGYVLPTQPAITPAPTAPF